MTNNTKGKRFIPKWWHEVAQWWVNGQVSDNEMLDNIEWLVKKGIIRIDK